MKFTSLLLFTGAALAVPHPLQERSSNQGLAGAAYSVHIFPAQYDFRGIDYSPQVVPLFSQLMPVGRGVTQNIAINNQAWTEVSGRFYSTTAPVWYSAVNHQFYIKAEVPGMYVVTLSGIQDNWTGVWVGRKATRYYFADNTDIKGGMENRVYQFPVTLKKNQVVPVRILHLNGAGPGSAYASVTGPSGLECIGHNTGATRFIYYSFPSYKDLRDPDDQPIEAFPEFPYVPMRMPAPKKIKTPPPPPPKKNPKHRKHGDDDDENTDGDDDGSNDEEEEEVKPPPKPVKAAPKPAPKPVTNKGKNY